MKPIRGAEARSRVSGSSPFCGYFPSQVACFGRGAGQTGLPMICEIEKWGPELRVPGKELPAPGPAAGAARRHPFFRASAAKTKKGFMAETLFFW